ncbi:MAG: rhodanese-like domain-containing protein [Alphaproteobacteria bacterium]|nr:rhodanese-like domain-containing protein [Alphaproteobacteria bacterium]
MSYTNPQAIVTTEWLSSNLHNSDIIVLDGTYHLPTANRNAAKEFNSKHIEGAVFFDIDDICDPESKLSHMLPSDEIFSEKVSALGVDNTKRIIVYDVYGMQSAARTWWMFRFFGHDNVAVLDGGLPKWIKAGNKVSSSPVMASPSSFKCNRKPTLVKNLDGIKNIINGATGQIIDARSSGRFNGTEPEPRAGMRSGHMPGAISLPFTKFLNPNDRTYKSSEDIKAIIKELNVDLDAPITTTCGSGVTACALSLGLFLIGKTDVAVYDGSWSEWGALADTAIIN